MNRDRFTLFFFLAANGLDGETAGLWTLLIDVRPDESGALRPIVGQYDQTAHRHIKQMQRQLEEGTLFRGDKPMMDLAKGYVVPT